MNTKARVGAALGAVLVGLTGLTVAAGGSASAGGSCTLVAPTKVAVSSPYRNHPVRLGSDCAASGISDAAWFAYNAAPGVQNVVHFDPSHRTDSWDLYDFEPRGLWTWRTGGAYTASGDAPIPQNTVRSDVRLASRAAMSATRSGANVTLTTTAVRYTPSVGKYARWSYVTGTVQYRKPGTAKWIHLQQVRANVSGQVSYRYRSTAVREYRLVLPASASTWGSIAATVRR